MKNCTNKPTRTIQGFTIIELLISTTLFSIVLVGALSAFLHIGQMYYKGISVKDTYEATQRIMDNVESDVRISKNATCDGNGTQNCPATGQTDVHYFCIGQQRYTYLLSSTTAYKIQPSDISSPNLSIVRGVIKDTINGCPPPSVIGTSAVQLLGLNMQLNDLNFYCVNDACHIHLHVVYYGGSDQVFASSTNPNLPNKALLDKDNFCNGGLMSTNFCAVSDVSSVVIIGS
jgi:prepilin-type N-terminal cleavage/methylation domain-containing protein